MTEKHALRKVILFPRVVAGELQFAIHNSAHITLLQPEIVWMRLGFLPLNVIDFESVRPARVVAR
jgi:hypothetical protein